MYVSRGTAHVNPATASRYGAPALEEAVVTSYGPQLAQRLELHFLLISAKIAAVPDLLNGGAHTVAVRCRPSLIHPSCS